MEDFQFRVTDGELEISSNLWGHFSMLYSQFQVGVSNIGGNIEAIAVTGDPEAQRQARAKYAAALKYVDLYLDEQLLKKGFAITELGANEAMSLYYAIRETVDEALREQRLQATEMTCLDTGLTGFLNKLLGCQLNVDKILRLTASLGDEELIKRVCEDINLRARRARA